MKQTVKDKAAVLDKYLSIQKNYEEVYEPGKTGLLYHYCSRETLWSILSNGLLYARHVRFSNDAEEYYLGKRIVEYHLKSQQCREEMDQIFMICFCEKDDLLSQWRGYAGDGVSLQFDFTRGILSSELSAVVGQAEVCPIHCFSIANGEQEKTMEFTVKLGNGSDIYTKFYRSPYAVQYTGIMNIDELGGSGFRKKDSRLLNKLDRLKSFSDKPASEERQFIPYIKSKRFKEEKEYRLTFDLANPGAIFSNEMSIEENSYLRRQKVFYLDKSGIRYPTIKVAYGDAEEREREQQIIYVADTVEENIYIMLEARLQGECKKIGKPAILRMIRYPLGNGRKNWEIIIGQGRYQERFFWQVDQVNSEIGYRINIWCDGYFPIRQIRIAPGRDQELFKASVEYYIRSVPWLKYVKVVSSGIPFRG